MQPGRNDPCPCGSGRKFKHCCLTKAEAASPDELTWRRVRRATEHLGRDLLREAAHHFGKGGLEEAWDEFNLFESDEPYDPDSPYVSLFFSWFLHDWLPDPNDTDLPEQVHTVTVAQAYLDRLGRRLDPIARRYVEACLVTPFSFHEVLECRPGIGMRLRDVLLGTETDALERMGSQQLQVGDIVFAKVIPIEGIALIEGMGPVPVPPVHKPAIIEWRRKLGTKDSLFGAETLRDYEFELRGLYLGIADSLLDPQLPELRNTDGDPIEMHTLVFDLDAPESAVEALRDLAVAGAEPEVERDAGGAFVRAELLWSRQGNKVHKEWDNTTLGSIRIEGTRLTAEVNSARRAAALRKLIEKRLGDGARPRPGVVQSVQSLIDAAPTPKALAKRAERERQQADLAASPEVQAVVREHMAKHYHAWLDQKIPALGNRTPRKAVREPDGREAVEALIAQIERDGERMQPPLDPEIVSELRRALGLAGGQ